MGFTVDITTLDIPENILVKMALLTMETDSFLGMHTHYTLELSMILAGEGEYRVDDRVYSAVQQHRVPWALEHRRPTAGQSGGGV